MLPTSVICWMSDRKFTYSYKDMRIQDKPLTTYQNIYSPLKITSWWRWNVSYSTMNYCLRSLKSHCEVVLGLCSLRSLSTTWHGSTLLTSSLCGSVTPTEDSLGVMCWGNMGMVASLDSQQSHNQHAAVTHTGMDTVCSEGGKLTTVLHLRHFIRSHHYQTPKWQMFHCSNKYYSLPVPGNIRPCDARHLLPEESTEWAQFSHLMMSSSQTMATCHYTYLNTDIMFTTLCSYIHTTVTPCIISRGQFFSPVASVSRTILTLLVSVAVHTWVQDLLHKKSPEKPLFN